MFRASPLLFSAVAMAIGLAMSHPTLADGFTQGPPSEDEKSVDGSELVSEEELRLAEKYAEVPEPAKEFVRHLQRLDTRYPDSANVDIDTFMAVEGETLALKYCGANGIESACAPTIMPDGNSGLMAVDPETYGRTYGAESDDWWVWLLNHLFNVGVIPETSACPAPYALTQIVMDDEMRRNQNSRSGWIGATGSNSDLTTYRFCKLDTFTSLNFRPLPVAGDNYDYSVLNMGVLCPSGARRVVRVEENELVSNRNSSSGDVFPSFRVYNTWFNFYCHFDGGANSFLGHMSGFPNVGMPYGVFASKHMPAPYALAKGEVYQDDEDILNWNAWWFGGGDSVMWDTRNTRRALAKVK
jgi:hypothetical protein